MPTPPRDLAVVSRRGRPHDVHTNVACLQDTDSTTEGVHPNLQLSNLVVDARRSPCGQQMRCTMAHWPCEPISALRCRPCPLRGPVWPLTRPSVTTAEAHSPPSRTIASVPYAASTRSRCAWRRPVSCAGGPGRSNALVGSSAPHKARARTLIVVCLRGQRCELRCSHLVLRSPL